MTDSLQQQQLINHIIHNKKKKESLKSAQKGLVTRETWLACRDPQEHSYLIECHASPQASSLGLGMHLDFIEAAASASRSEVCTLAAASEASLRGQGAS